MADNFIVLGDNKTIVQPDTCTTVTHEFTAEATDHPVEDGSAVTDNVVKKPRTCTATMLFSPVPLAEGNFTPTPGPDRPQKAFDLLADSMQRRERVNACFDGVFYSPAVITSLSIPRVFDDGTSRTINIAVKEILTVYSKTAKIKPNANIAKGTGKKKKNTNGANADPAILSLANVYKTSALQLGLGPIL